MEKRKKKDRSEEMKILTEKLEAGIQEVFESKNYKDYLKFMGSFWNYSVGNSILIHLQCPEATKVAGFNTWKGLKRYVKSGEKGIQIISGIPLKKDKKDADGKPVLDQTGKPVKEDSFLLFKPAYVFDVSQTAGEPLPVSPKIEELTGNAQCFEEIFEILSRRDFPVEIRDDIEDEAKGYFSEEEGRIVIRAGMSESQTIKTLIHETAHSILHSQNGKEKMKAKGLTFTRKDAEVQAESIAYVVCAHFGIDTSDYSFGYIASWAQGRPLKDLKGSLEVIRSTAGEIIDEIADGLVG